MSKVKFSNKNALFFNTLRERTDVYFKQNDLKTSGNYRLYIKTILLSVALVVSYGWLMFFTPQLMALKLMLFTFIGAIVAFIGFNVMHDGSHGSYSSRGWVNKCMAYALNIMGGNAYLWKQKHNINHHSYTNVEGMDDDIDIRPFVRVNGEQKKYFFHRFQHIYALFLYGFTYFFWVFYRDFYKYFTGKVADNTPLRKMSLIEHFNFWISKVIYTFLFIALPIYKLGLADALLGYGIMAFITGIILAVVFQLAHVVEESAFVKLPEGSTSIDSEWAIHQINTTANFATGNRVLSWLLGGLNFQIEHHLFPRISHIHYPTISKIVRATCREFNISYRSFPSMFSALRSHLLHLKKIGMT